MSDLFNEEGVTDERAAFDENIVTEPHIDENDFIELSDIVPQETNSLPPEFFEDIQDDVIIGENVDVNGAPLVNNCDQNNDTLVENDVFSSSQTFDNLTNNESSHSVTTGQPFLENDRNFKSTVNKTPITKKRRPGRPAGSKSTPKFTERVKRKYTKRSSTKTQNNDLVSDQNFNMSVSSASPISPQQQKSNISVSSASPISTRRQKSNISVSSASSISTRRQKTNISVSSTSYISTQRKRGRKSRKGRINIPVHNSDEVIEHVDKPQKISELQFCKLATDGKSNSDIQTEKNVLESSVNKIKKPSRRRGRKRKQLKENIELVDTDVVTAIQELECLPGSSCETSFLAENIDSEGDDLTLSMLKEKSQNVINEEVSDCNIDKAIESTVKIQTTTDDDPNSELNLVSTNNHNNEETDLLLEIPKKPCKRNSKKHAMDDYEYNIDSIVEKTQILTSDQNEDIAPLLSEDGRPLRQKARQKHYDENSDEDPYANVELSDSDAGNRHKRSYGYYSDYEYVPGKKQMSSDSAIDDDEVKLEDILKKNKRYTKRNDSGKSKTRQKSKSPIKNDTLGIVAEVTTLAADNVVDDDIESCLKSSVIKIKAEDGDDLGTSGLHNILASKMLGAGIQIKKVTPQAGNFSSITPLEIPVIDQNVTKKIEISAQTDIIQTKSSYVQTSSPYSLKIKNNVPLTSEQSNNACIFLKKVLTTTSELGTLMHQKADEFIQKKINTDYIKDNTKIDYCLKKAFLLFKLAKDNLVSMEETLEKQYEDFLCSNDLMSSFETEKIILPKNEKQPSSDSDCEIIEEPVAAKKQKFNPKTVFLNKELSIKIAKKPTETTGPSKNKQKLDIKGRHAVWINDSIMVKKVKPQQSFLAQDTRFKKPPDYILEDYMNDFFHNYYHKLSICAPFTSLDYLDLNSNVITCNYFVEEKLDGHSSSSDLGDSCSEDDGFFDGTSSENIPIFNHNYNFVGPSNLTNEKFSTVSQNPQSLIALCTDVINKYSSTLEQQVKMKTYNPKTLLQISLNNIIEQDEFINYITQGETVFCHSNIFEVASLKSLSYKKVVMLLCEKDMKKKVDKALMSDCTTMFSDKESIYSTQANYTNDSYMPSLKPLATSTSKIKSLSSLCLDVLQHDFSTVESVDTNIIKSSTNPKSLLEIVYHNILHLMYKNSVKVTIENHQTQNKPAVKQYDDSKRYEVKCLFDMSFKVILKHMFTGNKSYQQSFNNIEIDNVNSISQETFLNTDDFDESCGESEHYSDGYYNSGEVESPERNWDSQIELQELKSCLGPIIQNIHTENSTYDDYQDNIHNEETYNHIKMEPIDETTLLDNITNTKVKHEPIDFDFGMVSIPDTNISKREFLDSATEYFSERNINRVTQENNSCIDSFDQFLEDNVLARTVIMGANTPVFSQSNLRIRRQYEPDSDDEVQPDTVMNLLIPQNSEPISIETAKKTLMEKSSDDENLGQEKKKVTDLPIKRKRGRPPKKPINMPQDSKNDTYIDKNNTTKEIEILTKRMRGKIRNNEKKNERNETSHSDDDEAIISSKQYEDNSSSTLKNVNNAGKSLRSNKLDEFKTQFNSADKGQQENETIKQTEPSLKKSSYDIDQDTKFAGFTADDQTQSLKYMQLILDKIPHIKEQQGSICDFNNSQDRSDRVYSPVMMTEAPVELLECEPSMPIFDEDDDEAVKRLTKSSNKKNKKETLEEKDNVANNFQPKEEIKLIKHHEQCDGWHIYPINNNDTKLFAVSNVTLLKLPEVFVQTYFKYINLEENDRDHLDNEIERLTNLRSLCKVTSAREKVFNKARGNIETQKTLRQSRDSEDTLSVNNEHFDELEPSDDEHLVEDQPASPVKEPPTNNSLAKDFLLNEENSDSDNLSNTEDAVISNVNNDIKIENDNETKFISGPKSRKRWVDKKISAATESLVLTADKMMKKELDLLYAPVIMKEDAGNEDDISKVSPQMHKTRRSPRSGGVPVHGRAKTDDDSSSEEEKMWVNTKSKLLKRMEKRTLESMNVDDAKRAKLVSEYIEKHEDKIPGTKRSRGGPKRKMSRRKLLEREKQLSVLTRELFGEDPSNPHILPGKKTGANYFKGRRNIRKVIDKKSLARSTLVANIEEFERKKRLNIIQTRLRELLGYEESVDVVVINNELCLEYDFEKQKSVVTVHPFFTKVMKAHQCSGVKFLWDACFESARRVSAGAAGGGCILAHCMGLGKTLQVLALLHAVLSHPRLAVRRVLVCCPLSTVLNWVDEINKWLGPVTDQIKVFELSKLKKTYERAYQLEDWYNGGGIFIIGYELFRSLSTLDPILDDVRPTIVKKIRNALLDPGPDIVVCDEGHLLKNDSSVLAVAMSRVRTKRRIVLTGTPIQNNLREYYCMVNFVKPNLLGTYAEYSNRFENPIMNGQHRDSSEADIKLMKARTHILHKVLEGCLQRQEVSVLYPYLPSKHEYTVFISLSKCQSDLYRHYLEKFARQSKQSILKDFHILQKIWSHPQVLHNFLMRTRNEVNIAAIAGTSVKEEKVEDDLAREDLTSEDVKPGASLGGWWLQHIDGNNMINTLEASNKFVTVFKILDECIQLNDKVLLFSTSLFTMDALEYFLKKMNNWSLGQEYYRLDGSVPPEVRQKWCREFNAESNHMTRLFLISTRAGSLGLNMTAANRVILFDTSWNPAHDVQSIFRVYRFGQKKDCYIYRLVAMGTMEQKIYERAVTKQAVSCRVVDEQQIDRHYNMAELSELYRFDCMGEGVAGGVALGVRDVALLRVARDTPALHAVHEHDSLLRDTGEQELPEHERAAAWDQFQQEQTDKQMEDSFLTKQAKVPLKRTLSIYQNKNSPHLTLDGEEKTIKNEFPEPGACDPEYVPHNEPKRKRVKKLVPENACDIPIQNNMKQDDNYTASVVSKVAKILVKHNYHKMSGSLAVSEMAKIVTNLISNKEIQKSEGSTNEYTLADKIAQVLMTHNNGKKDEDTMDNKKTVLQVSDELEIITYENKQKVQTVADTNHHNSIDLQQPSTSKELVAPSDTSQIKMINRTKRNAANAAEKYIQQFKDHSEFSIVDDDDDDDFVITCTNNLPKASTDLIVNNSIETNEKVPQNKVTDNINIVETHNSLPMELGTVVLSDDDDDDIIHVDTNYNSPPPPNLLVTPNLTISTSQKAIIIDPTTDKQEDPVPLHPALLKNQNFIKIIAHTYQKRNPDLDDCSALLASEYSINKILNDITIRKIPLTSGIVYDVAMQMIGKHAMEELWKSVDPSLELNSSEVPKKDIKHESVIKVEAPTNSTAKPSPTVVTKSTVPPIIIRRGRRIVASEHTITSDVIIRDSESPHKSYKPKPRRYQGKSMPSQDDSAVHKLVMTPGGHVVEVKSSSTTQERDFPIVGTVTSNVSKNRSTLNFNKMTHRESVATDSQEEYFIVPDSDAADVVPVSLIRRAVCPETRGREEESILPDDDDEVRITSSPVSAAPLPSPRPTPGSSTSLPHPIPTYITKNVPAVSVTIQKAVSPAPTLSVTSTICLDSDDETDAPCPSVSLSAVEPDNDKTRQFNKIKSILATKQPGLYMLPTKLLEETSDKKLSEEVAQIAPMVPVTKGQRPSPELASRALVNHQPKLIQEIHLAPATQATKRQPIKTKPKQTQQSPTATQTGHKNTVSQNSSNSLNVKPSTSTLKPSKYDILESRQEKPNNVSSIKSKTSRIVFSNKVTNIDLDSDEEVDISEEPPSRSNPLDVLKNVVHIPAEYYSKTTSPSPRPTPAKTTTNSNKSVNITPNNILKGTSATHIKSQAKSNAVVSKKQIETPKKVYKEGKMLGSIDLTSEMPTQIAQCTVKSVVKTPTLTRSVKAPTASSTSKSTVSNTIKKTVDKNVSAKTSESNSSSTKPKAAPVKVSSTSKPPLKVKTSRDKVPWQFGEVKRKTTLVNEACTSKKKKTNMPMSLEDFTLDDLEDIIELE